MFFGIEARWCARQRRLHAGDECAFYAAIEPPGTRIRAALWTTPGVSVSAASQIEDVSFRLDNELRWLRACGFTVDVAWRRIFAVVVATEVNTK